MTPSRLLIGLLLISLLLPVAGWAAESPLIGTVSWIYDGDTIKLDPLGKVRLLGIDTPESESGPRDDYYLRQGLTRNQLRLAAKQAKEWLIRNLKGKQVRLTFDRVKRDKYGRLLAYAYLPDGRLVNRLLVEQGLASVFRRYEFALKEDFLAVEATAKTQKLGLWREQE